jgi:catechol 2,3-dioxygenase-like lactoylglutathione lyase family enzyme
MAITHKTAIEGIDCTVYLVKDLDRALKFWRDTMGLTVTQEYPGDTGAEFSFSDDTTFSLYKMADGTWHPGSGIMFRVPDIASAVEHFKARGVAFEQFEGQQHVLDTPVCSMAFAKDSEGNDFMLHERKAD